MSAKANLIVDALILIAFLVAFEPALTGIAVHEWLSLAFGATLILHILLHWKWVVHVTLKFFRMFFHSSRFNYLVNAALFVTFVLVMLSGVLISESILPTLGFRFNASPTWRFLHSSSADAVVLLVGLHFALHWKWIVNTIKRYLFKPLRRRPVPLTLQPAVLPVHQDER
ncbi:MAG: DUF4405 domain-containing protein [Anaerolineales bacterium]|nr:DUF4405 domain-containing protein [Anaerolineales bacterium]